MNRRLEDLRLPLPYGPYPLRASALRAVAAEAVALGWALAHRTGRWVADSRISLAEVPEDEFWELSRTIESLRSVSGIRFADATPEVVPIVEEMITDAVITGAASYEPQLERRERGEDAEIHLILDPAWMAGIVAPLIRQAAHDLGKIGIVLPDLTRFTAFAAPFGEEAG